MFLKLLRDFNTLSIFTFSPTNYILTISSFLLKKYSYRSNKNIEMIITESVTKLGPLHKMSDE